MPLLHPITGAPSLAGAGGCNGAAVPAQAHATGERARCGCALAWLHLWLLRLIAAVQCCWGLLTWLMTCTALQVIHRDVKSPNLLIDRDFHLKVRGRGKGMG